MRSSLLARVVALAVLWSSSVLLAVLPATTGPAAAAPALPAGLQDVVVLSGLSTPTAMRFGGDGRIFVAEKRGTVKVFDGLADIAPTTVADLSAKVYDYGDRGLLGLAVPPDLAADPAVYVLYAVDPPAGGSMPRWNDDCPTPPGADVDGCLVNGRLSRLPLSGDVATGEQVLLEGWCQQFSSHSVGALAFDRTGALLVSGGDGASFTGVDYGQMGGTHAGDKPNPCGDPPGAVGTALTAPTAEGGSLRSQSLGRTSGPVLLNGSILRLDPRTGAARSDNPFANAADANRARTIATGLRNPFRFTVRPGTDEVWLGDVGWNYAEEINRIRSTTDGVVENFGWPCYEGTQQQAGYRGAGLNACQRLYNAPGSVANPYFEFPHAAAVVPNDGCPPGGSSVSGAAFAGTSRYPAPYSGALFFGDYSRNCIWAMPIGAGGDPDPAALRVVVSQAAGPVDLQTGPDGWMYYVGIYDGGIHRIETTTATPSPGTQLSSLNWTSMTNGWGPVERNTDNGDIAAGDGGPMVIAGKTYPAGLGAHAASSISYAVPPGCTTFDATVGVDDYVGSNGSVVFGVRLDGAQVWESPVLRGTSAALPVQLPLGSASTLTLTVGDGGDGSAYDHADWADARLTCGGTTPPPTTPPAGTTYVSTLTPTSAVNGWGVAENDRSNGDVGPSDGGPLTIEGAVFARGLGVHAASEHAYDVPAGCTSFSATVGVDDEVGGNGSVVFGVLLDGATEPAWSSPVLRGTSAGVPVTVPLGAAKTFRLRVQDGGDGVQYDHADWGDARLSCGGTTPPPTDPPAGTTYVSTLTPKPGAVNGWGPVEPDRSNGDIGASDGGPLSVEGAVFARGLGAHAASELTFDVPAGCTSFSATVGVDDEVGGNGSVVFEVLRDGVTLPAAWTSPLLRGTSAGVPVTVPLGAAKTFSLVVEDGGDGVQYDHADWGDARLTCGGSTPPTDPPPGANQPPVPTITSPTSPPLWSVGDRITFAGSATDPETGALSASGLKWNLVHHHCPAGVCHTHPVTEWKDTATGGFTTSDIDYPGWYELVLTATDPAGGTGVTSVKLEPRTVTLTFTTNPGGLRLEGLVVGSGSATTPFTRTVIVGSANTVSAPSPQTSKNNKTYNYQSWSDGLGQNHTIIAPAVPNTYTAVYRQR